MNSEDQKLFEQLKTAVSAAFLANHSAPADIKNWKGEDIVTFQEDLLSKTKTSISEKWFYTYFKNNPQKLPRIDMLNLLSNYAGYQNWNDFKNTHNKTLPAKEKKKNYKYLMLLPALLLIALAYKLNSKNEFQFCFVDDIKNQTIKSNLDIKILQANESPVYLKTDSLGCFSYTTQQKTIQFVVQSPYYKTDTIIRSIDAHTNSTIKLSSDDYALMLQYYSNGNRNDWKKRKQQLQSLIADDAQIYQVFTNGIELYEKDEFITKLMIPTSSLKNIKILDKSYKNGKIIKLKFTVK